MMTRIQFGDMREHTSSVQLSAVMTAHKQSILENRDYAVLKDLRVVPLKPGLEGILEVCRAPLSEDELILKNYRPPKRV